MSTIWPRAPLVSIYSGQPKCATCRHFFWWGDSPAPENGMKICNHPSVSGQGRSPLKRPSDSCRKYELEQP